ncbi:aminoglycoside phosphotransferase family protein [Nonomuraea terrae]|uniref:Aminoglycoside phosphotransferase family protein n=1 Tax=Nonomuraea terrae TaxID=2530383 RepID=A0A4R4YUS3_9ACTN|nr:aminoglycoside phosphotransferase family protein [Nonomuraea terrae]TDD47372.1 aminoglycoside phosphotransferase family protein [Nonomuraea terrae]
MTEEVLQDTPDRGVVRVGDTVRRPVQPWTPAVHALLRHLADAGFRYAPRVLGIDEQGREVLTYVEGAAGAAGWAQVVSDEGLAAFARLLRDYHDAVAGFRPPGDLAWITGRCGIGDGELVCHGDFGPWNVVWSDGVPAGILDWDNARPGSRVFDVAYALEYTAPFRDDSECLRWLGYREPPDRRRRMELFAAAYGLPGVAGLAGEVAAVQRDTIAQVRRLAAQGRRPQARWVAEGYLGELERRRAWTLANRRLFG